MKLLFYSIDFSPRLKYICQQVFTDWLGFSIEYTNNEVFYQTHKGIKINYSIKALESEDFVLPKSTLLSEYQLQNQPLSPILYNKIPALFPCAVPNAVFPFDLLATIFFHLSRYEEYLPFQADQHGRFPASESWAYQNGCLQKPIVDLLVQTLKLELRKKFPNILFKPQHFQFMPTYDIDMAWAFQYKGWKRAIGGYFNDLLKGQFAVLKNRIKTQLHLQEDPFQTFIFLANLSRKYNLHPTYFFLLGDYGLHDKSNRLTAPAFQDLIRSIAKDYSIGIHPSYQSTGKQKIINKEKKRLVDITQQPIHRSRQHFLKLKLPATYRQLIAAGITEDYSMGYAMDIGFRAGTSLPFYWYNLANETSSELLLYPFQIMDVTLKEYLKLNPITAKTRIHELIAVTKSVNGIFCSLWHNSSFSELEGWQDWQAVYIDLIEQVTLKT